jgi:hypothetical protein
MDATTRPAFGAFLDDLPKALYVVAHIAFLAVGLWLWAHARSGASFNPAALLLYAASQVVFFGYFANWITFKMAVLVEQTLMVIMVCVIAAGAL